jgi:uncharacterized SAM-binding protein YcdF (DUF218 family)
MSISWLIVNAVSALLLPPMVFLLPALAGWRLRNRRPVLASVLCMGSVLALLALSTKVGAWMIGAPLEHQSIALTSARDAGAQAIVVLGGGRLRHAPEYAGKDSPAPRTLARLRYGAALHRETGLPVLVSGGSPGGTEESEASVMALALRADFGVAAKWLEQESDNTAENARFSSKLLKQAGVQRVLLVTDALHMPRAQLAFRQAGLQTIAAPTSFFFRGGPGAIDFVPNSDGLGLSHYAVHEWIGLTWYRIHYGSGQPEMNAQPH